MNEFKLYAVAGNPVLFSRSPQIYNTLFHRMGLNAHYLRLSCSSVSEVRVTAREMKVSGLNITSPFKEEALSFLHKKAPRVEKIGAVNTLIFKPKQSWGYNTDPDGVFRSLYAHGIGIYGKRCAVLGAGGAGRAAVYALQKSGAQKVILMNRTFSRAQRSARLLGCRKAPFSHLPRILAQCDLLVSCVPRLSDCVDKRNLPSHVDILDASYRHPSMEPGSDETPGGLDWLFYQALPAFRLFTGRKVPPSIEEFVRRRLIQEEKKEPPHIALVGFMGSGKTTVGKVLAEKLRIEFTDTDRAIERIYGRKIKEIFRREGERRFREMERSFIPRMLQRSSYTVFSVGGGAVLDPQIRKNLQERCRVLWLWSPVSEALRRADLPSRPLLGEGGLEKAEQLLVSRLPFYARASDMVVPSPTGKIQNTAGRITDEIHQARSR